MINPGGLLSPHMLPCVRFVYHLFGENLGKYYVCHSQSTLDSRMLPTDATICGVDHVAGGCFLKGGLEQVSHLHPFAIWVLSASPAMHKD